MMIMMIMTTMTVYGNDCDDDEDTDNSCKIHKKIGKKKSNSDLSENFICVVNSSNTFCPV